MKKLSTIILLLSMVGVFGQIGPQDSTWSSHHYNTTYEYNKKLSETHYTRLFAIYPNQDITIKVYHNSVEIGFNDFRGKYLYQALGYSVAEDPSFPGKKIYSWILLYKETKFNMTYHEIWSEFRLNEEGTNTLEIYSRAPYHLSGL